MTLETIREMVKDQMLEFEALSLESPEYEETYEYFSDLYQGLITGNFEIDEIDKLINMWNESCDDDDIIK